MDLLKGALGGIIGGVIGAVIWGLIAYNAHIESGWVAWGIGGLAGFGVSLGMGGKGSLAAGVMAVVIALASIAGGKFAAIQFEADSAFSEIDKVVGTAVTDEQVLLSLVQDAAEKALESGRPVAFKNGKNIETAESIDDFPDAMVKLQRGYQEGLTDEQRAYLRNEKQEQFRTAVGAFKSDIKSEAFVSSFTPFDFLFGLFAVLTAWRLGSADRG